MKANELMVGDFATIHLPNGTKVTRKLDIGDLSFFVEFDPIPLTPEILEKNGFKKSEYGWYNRKIDEWEIEIYIGRIEVFVKINKGVYPHINNTDCHFVHQLQHALRLCEIKKEITL